MRSSSRRLLIGLILAWLGGVARTAARSPQRPSSPRTVPVTLPINVSLSWPPGAAARFDVYFGATNPPPFQSRVDKPSFVLETLAAGTTYYWRVDAVTGEGVKAGTVQRFTTAKAVGSGRGERVADQDRDLRARAVPHPEGPRQLELHRRDDRRRTVPYRCANRARR